MQELRGCVLVIDDEAGVCEVVSDMLNDAGVKTMSAASGEEGIALFQLRMHEINLVLLDLSMPGIGGKEAFRRLKALKPDLKIILSSGYSQAEITDDLRQLGLAGFIQKPYRFDKLNDLIRKFLDGSTPS
jgi:two-component system cell cycle sensor histidine kinase/response regulator CckA